VEGWLENNDWIDVTIIATGNGDGIARNNASIATELIQLIHGAQCYSANQRRHSTELHRRSWARACAKAVSREMGGNGVTLSWNLEVDWPGTGTFTDERNRLLGLSTRRGRNSIFTESGKTPMFMGEGWFQLENYDDRYNPFNASSPLYGNMLPGRLVRVSAVDGVTYRVFTGYLADIRPQGSRSQTAIMKIVDGSRYLSKQKCSAVTPQSNYLVSAAIDDLLAMSLWPLVSSVATFPLTFPITLGSQSIENNGDTIDSFSTNTNQTIWDALNDIAEAFLGTIYIEKGGALAYRTRTTAPVTISSFSADDVDPEIEQDMPWDTIWNDIRITPTAGGEQTGSDSASANTYGPSTFSITGNAFIQSAAQANDIITMLLLYLPVLKRGIRVNMNPNSSLQFSPELLNSTNVYIPELGIDGLYDIGYIQHEWVAGGECHTRFGLEPNYYETAGLQVFPLTFPITLGW
jgi:hypothetical protein